MVNGLRVFVIDDVVATATAIHEFYSRRSDGPYYRWWYENGLQRWCFARVRAPDFPTRPLSCSSWKSLPIDLQRSLVEHYQD